MMVAEPVEIRLLGSLRVRRCDNSAVHATEWRTSKTVDLLRLLALNAEQPVRVDSLLDKLWPNVEESKGRASLRTAASQIRRTLRADCIERRLGGLALTNVWVDVAAFRDLAVEARAFQRASDHAQVVGLARQAEALYLGDFEASDGDSDWAKVSRDSIANLRIAVLTDAVESAVELGWLRDAVDLATLVIDSDPYSDRGHRGLMHAYAGLGENDHALRVFADFRSLLDQELGIAPSAQTQALQMSLLSGATEPSPSASWLGPEGDRTAVVDLVTGTHEAGVRVLCVAGEPGSGREAVIDASLDQTGVTAVRLHPKFPAPLPSITQIEAAARRTRVVVLPPLDECDDTDVAELVCSLDALTSVEGVTVAVPVDANHLEPLLLELEMVQMAVDVVELHALNRPELERLASAVLCGPLAGGLLDTLMAASGGLPGRASTALRAWLKNGRIQWTPSGLDLVPSQDSTSNPEIDKLVRRILERLCPLGTDVVALLALIDRPATASLVVNLLDPIAWPDVTEEDVDLALDLLADLGALRLGPDGYGFTHQRMRASIEDWLRHGVRRRMHRQLAMSPLIPSQERAGHWIKAGDPDRAEQCERRAARRSKYVTAELPDLDVALTREVTSAVSSVPLAEAADLTTRAALLEAAVRRALEPLLDGAHMSVTLSVVPDTRATAARASVVSTDTLSMTTVPMQRPA